MLHMPDILLHLGDDQRHDESSTGGATGLARQDACAGTLVIPATIHTQHTQCSAPQVLQREQLLQAAKSKQQRQRLQRCAWNQLTGQGDRPGPNHSSATTTAHSSHAPLCAQRGNKPEPCHVFHRTHSFFAAGAPAPAADQPPLCTALLQAVTSTGTHVSLPGHTDLAVAETPLR